VASVVLTAPASARSAGPHDPVGAAERLTAPSRTSVNFVGWAADPDAMTHNVRVAGFVDGNWASGVTTNLSRPWITSHYGTSRTPGFSLTIPVPNDGRVHTACVAVRTIGAGLATVLRCTPTPLGTSLSSTQLAAHRPKGSLSWVSGWTGTLHVIGYATDPDMRSRPSVVVIYVDGSQYRTVTTSTNTTAAATGSGPYSRFNLALPVASGSHMACAWAVDVGLGGGNTLLGCAAGDTRGAAGTGPVSTPAADTAALAEAVKHQGEPYVWGAAGPHSFDCSGLVLYSYGKAGITTPRVSQDQFRAARRIPASRAVPGDLVFWYDTSGDVYHVSFYVSSGRGFAAIDTQEGVDYQSLTWTTMLSYGSFTHS
jgi:cell wall-associated NlpC family hydrolase